MLPQKNNIKTGQLRQLCTSEFLVQILPMVT